MQVWGNMLRIYALGGSFIIHTNKLVGFRIQTQNIFSNKIKFV
jgi:hypothetical protein